jgi:hypothetical protein
VLGAVLAGKPRIVVMVTPDMAMMHACWRRPSPRRLAGEAGARPILPRLGARRLPSSIEHYLQSPHCWRNTPPRELTTARCTFPPRDSAAALRTCPWRSLPGC